MTYLGGKLYGHPTTLEIKKLELVNFYSLFLYYIINVYILEFIKFGIWTVTVSLCIHIYYI